MNQELQIKATILDIEPKWDKNGHPYFRLSLSGLPNRYFYAFSFHLPAETWSTLTNAPYNFINQPVRLTYQALPNKDNSGTFYQVQQIELT